MVRYRYNEIRTETDFPMDSLPSLIARKLGIRESDISWWEIRRKSTDSRKKPHIQYVYTVDFTTDRKIRNVSKIRGLDIVDPEKERVLPPECGSEKLTGRPVVVGLGPAGLFAGLELARRGYRPIVIERGPSMDRRINAVERFRKDRILDPEANMLFGEGGAGTFSDGKLGTGIKDGLIRQVLSEFRDAGAGEDIMYLAKPHIGTDVLREVIVNMRRKITEAGGEVVFGTKLESLQISDGGLERIVIRTGKIGGWLETNALILAVGHSARDTFAMINDAGLEMQQKPFSIGVRIEHPQYIIDAAQYGEENAERFAGIFRSGKLFLDLFHTLFDRAFAVIVGIDPFHTVEDVAARHGQSEQEQFLDTVGISSRCVEHDDSLLDAFVDRDGIVSDAGPADTQKFGIPRVSMHVRCPYKDRVRIAQIVADSIQIRCQDLFA